MAPGHAAGSGEISVYTNLNKIMEEIFFIFTFAFFFVLFVLPVLRSRSRSEPVLFGRSWCEGLVLAPGSGSTLDKH